jgi:hypothetical protein
LWLVFSAFKNIRYLWYLKIAVSMYSCIIYVVPLNYCINYYKFEGSIVGKTKILVQPLNDCLVLGGGGEPSAAN